jgi:hypothetical protein
MPDRARRLTSFWICGYADAHLRTSVELSSARERHQRGLDGPKTATENHGAKSADVDIQCLSREDSVDANDHAKRPSRHPGVMYVAG